MLVTRRYPRKILCSPRPQCSCDGRQGFFSTQGQDERRRSPVAPLLSSCSSSSSQRINRFSRGSNNATNPEHKTSTLRVSTADNSDSDQCTLLETISQALLTVQKECPASSSYVYLLGVSGGCDSIALFHLLRQLLLSLRNVNNAILHVVHFDHQQRGADSMADADFVRALCYQYQINMTCYRWDQDHDNPTASSSSHSTTWNLSFSQDTARQWRRQRMKQLLHELVAGSTHPSAVTTGFLLTAHHQEDHRETVLLKILRGTHLTNLQGIPLFSKDTDSNDNSNDNVGIYWVRPLLSVTKADLIQYLQRHDYEWREDASNDSPKYLRNRVRHELVPLLQDLVGGRAVLDTRLGHMMEQSQDLHDYLTKQANTYLEQSGCTDSNFALPMNGSSLPFIAKHALYIWISRQQQQYHNSINHKIDAETNNSHVSSLSYDQWSRVCKQFNDYPQNRKWQMDMGGRWGIERIGDVLRLRPPASPDQTMLNSNKVAMRERSGTEVDWHIADDDMKDEQSNGDFVRVNLPCKFGLDQSRLIFTSASYYQGASFAPSWRSKAIKIKDFLRSQKIPLHLRGTTPLLVLQARHADKEKPLQNGVGGANQDRIVAVYIMQKQQWVLDAEFAQDDCESVKLNILVPTQVDLIN